MRIIFIVLLTFIGVACQTNPMVCPSPELVKLKKTRAHRIRYAMAKRQEAKANSYDYFQVSQTKSLSKIEEWDCPKPGLKHDKMVAKKAKDLQRRYAKNLKKIAKKSEERTITVTSKNE